MMNKIVAKLKMCIRDSFRPEKRFMDAVKGLLVYGTKTVRPKELYTIKAHEA